MEGKIRGEILTLKVLKRMILNALENHNRFRACGNGFETYADASLKLAEKYNRLTGEMYDTTFHFEWRDGQVFQVVDSLFVTTIPMFSRR